MLKINAAFLCYMRYIEYRNKHKGDNMKLKKVYHVAVKTRRSRYFTGFAFPTEKDAFNFADEADAGGCEVFFNIDLISAEKFNEIFSAKKKRKKKARRKPRSL
jgi:hypothetical protein